MSRIESKRIYFSNILSAYSKSKLFQCDDVNYFVKNSTSSNFKSDCSKRERMIVDMPHRLTFEQEDLFVDRRLSDLLPVEFIHQIGFDPNQFLFDQNNLNSFFQRRKTDPGFSYIYPNPEIHRRNTTMELVQNHEYTQTWFSVQLKDKTVNAFVRPNLPILECEGVVVIDGLFLRYGKIIKRIFPSSSNISTSSYQIISFDENSILEEYLTSQNRLAMILIPKLIQKLQIQTKLLDVETVSFETRSLIRIKLSNLNIPNLDSFTRHIINLFYTAVELISD